MAFLEIRTENPQMAYNRVSRELKEIEGKALGAGATKKDIDKYNNLHEQVRRKHFDGTIGHLHLNQEILLFDGRIVVPALDKKIPFKLKQKA